MDIPNAVMKRVAVSQLSPTQTVGFRVVKSKRGKW